MSQTDTELKPKISPLARILIGLAVIIGLGLTVIAVKLLTTKPLSLPAGKVIDARLIIAPGTYHVGDLIPVKLEVAAIKGINFVMPNLAVINLGQLELKASGKLRREYPRGGIRRIVQYHFTGWQVGEFPIAGLAVEYQTASGKKRIYQVPTSKIKIVTVLPGGKSEQELLVLPLKKAKEPLNLPPHYQILWWFLAIVAAISLIYLLARFLQKIWPRKKEILAALVPEIREPAHLVALRRLEALQKLGCLAKGEYKPYYIELSETIREYMENRFQIPALEMTTEEFLADLTGNNRLELKHQFLIADFLKSSDLVKFAKYLPAHQEAEKSFAFAKQLVEETKREIVTADNSTNIAAPNSSNQEYQNDIS